MITTLGTTIEARDVYTSGHCERLVEYADALDRALDAPEPLRRALRLGGYLHDLGKVAVPDSILLKPGRLTPEEREQINRHPAVGADLARGLHTLDDVRPIIRHHRERWNGSGYPDGLRSRSGRGSWRWSTSTTPCVPRARTSHPCRSTRRSTS